MYRHPTSITIEDMIRPVVESLGSELLGVEFKPSQYGSLLRLYIDNPNGVGLAECEQVSRQVSALLDIEDPIQNEYNLEVSSPGEDRPLFTLSQFASHIGERAKLVLGEPHQGRRRFTGILQSINDGEINIVLDDQQAFSVPFSSLSEARLAPLQQ